MSQKTLRLPEGFEWVAWEPAMQCVGCGRNVSAIARSVEREQQMYDEWAKEHKRMCPAA